LDTITQLSSCGHGARGSRLAVVARAEAYMRAHPASPLPVSTLSRLLGISERGLRNAFHDVRGMSPKQCMVLARLEKVRRALNDAGGRPLTVTAVATEHGFYELGRFAAAYKQLFGEPPSETLRRASRRVSVVAGVESKGMHRVSTTSRRHADGSR
jgi:transcriptional regulator GlxA family with amidase domain